MKKEIKPYVAPLRSEPIEILVINDNEFPCKVNLFNGNIALNSRNFGNKKGVTIKSLTTNVTYASVLESIATCSLQIGMTFIQVKTGSNTAVSKSWFYKIQNSSGFGFFEKKNPKMNPMQNHSSIIEYYNTFILTGYAKITIEIPAKTSVEYSFYPSKSFGGVIDPVSDFKRAMIDFEEKTLEHKVIEFSSPQTSRPQIITMATSLTRSLPSKIKKPTVKKKSPVKRKK